MFANFATPAAQSFPRFSPKAVLARIAAAVVAAEARAKTRRDYGRLLESDEMMRDVGVTPDAVRRAMKDLDGQA